MPFWCKNIHYNWHSWLILTSHSKEHNLNWALWSYHLHHWIPSAKLTVKYVLHDSSIASYKCHNKTCNRKISVRANPRKLSGPGIIFKLPSVGQGQFQVKIQGQKKIININPHTDGVWATLVPTWGGALIIAPRRSRKQRKLETSGKRHWIRTDEFYNFCWGHF